jgi:hypothetical protein
MLKLKDIVKKYYVGDQTVDALKGINLKASILLLSKYRKALYLSNAGISLKASIFFLSRYINFQKRSL